MSETGEMDKKIKDTGDRISQLPDVIAHHILSFIESPEDFVRISVLSKKWFALTAAFPNLDFYSYEVRQTFGLSQQECGPGTFYKYVDNRISRFCKENVSANSFKLLARVVEPIKLDTVDRWIGLIVEKNVQELMLRVDTIPPLGNDQPKSLYRLPNTLLSASCLTTLRIYECELPSSLMVDGVKFKSLKVLLLDCVPIDDETLTYLTTACPLLEQIIVTLCKGLKRFTVNGLQNLRHVAITYRRGFEGFDIEAPNLKSIFLQDSYKARVPSSVNVVSCQKLIILSLDLCDSASLKGFAILISNLPFIEDISLRMMSKHDNKLKFSSHSLKRFMLFGYSTLKDIKINAPNLFLFKYHNGVKVVPCNPKTFSSLESKKCMEYHCDISAGSHILKSLRRFLDEHKFKVLNLYIDKASMCVENLKAIQSPAFELEHVELKFNDPNNFLVYVAVVDAVFWCCRPRSFTLGFSFKSFNFAQLKDVIEHTHTILSQQENGQTNIRIEMSSASKTKENFNNLNSLWRELPNYLHVQVTFIKEKGGLHVDGANGNS